MKKCPKNLTIAMHVHPRLEEGEEAAHKEFVNQVGLMVCLLEIEYKKLSKNCLLN